MKYETYCLDEAAYLALRGYSVTVTRTGPVSALFSFKTDEHFNEARAGFWKGEESVLLHRWLATRAALKNECIGQARSAKHVHHRRSYLSRLSRHRSYLPVLVIGTMTRTR